MIIELEEQIGPIELTEQITEVYEFYEFEVPSGMLASLFTAAGQLLASNGAASPTYVPAPTAEAQMLVARLGQTIKMAWEAVDLSQLTQTTVKTAAYTAINNDHVLVNASGAGADFEIALPATPATGNKVRVTMVAGHATYKVTIGRNGSLVNGGTSTTKFSLINKGDTFYFEYTGATLGWICTVGFESLTREGESIAAAATTDIGAASGYELTITGNTTITSFGTAAAGIIRILKFSGTPLLTYNATSLKLPGAANYQVVAGDTFTFISEGSGNWKCVGYALISGFAMGGAASQAEEEAASSTTVFTSPGRQQYHPSAAKAWVCFNGTGTLAIMASYNVSSVTDNGTGDYTVNFITAMSDANYSVTAGMQGVSGSISAHVAIFGSSSGLVAPSTSSFRISTWTFGGALTDSSYIMSHVFR